MSAEELLAARANESGVRVSDVRGRCRIRRLATLRAWIAAELRGWGLSYPEIGRVLHRHHTSVMYYLGAARRVQIQGAG